MLEKSRNAVFFQWFVCRVSRKVGSLKWRVRSYVVRGEIKNRTPLWREAHFEVKMLKNWHSQTTFWSWDVEKWHAAVVRSTFSSENVQNVTFSDHFLKLRCWKIARRCSEKHILKGNVEKLHAAVAWSTFWSENAKKLRGSEHFLKLRCSKITRHCGAKHILKWKCTKHVSFGALFEVEMLTNCPPLWREVHLSVKL